MLVTKGDDVRLYGGLN